MQLNDALTKDLKNTNFSKELITKILNNCTFDKSELLFIDENGTDCFIIFNISDNESANIIEAKNYLECEENNFYDIKMNIFNKFEDEYKINLDNSINNIIKKIESNYFDEQFLSNFLKNNYKSDEYKEINIEYFYANFDGMYDLIEYINNLKDIEYKNFLSDAFIKSFNESYSDFIDNFLASEIIDNSTLLINNRIEIYIDYILEKLSNEYYYYLFILNSTEEIGNSSKMALINLFPNIKENINEAFNNIIENDIYFYINIFFRENVHLFKNNYFDYYLKKLNEYNINIYKSTNYLEELLANKNFNKTLDLNSNELIKSITEKIKIKI